MFAALTTSARRALSLPSLSSAAKTLSRQNSGFCDIVRPKNRRDTTGREDCKEPPAKVGFSKDGCEQRRPVPQAKAKEEPIKSMWERPECCRIPCPDLYPRFDELYYKPSDKAKRVYMQTWWECPSKMKEAPICNYEDVIYPVAERRKFPKVERKEECPKPVQIRSMPKGGCVRLSFKDCSKARVPPKCNVNKMARDCQKICCPYPSYSECLKPEPRKKPITECHCLDFVPMCTVFEEMRKRSALKIIKFDEEEPSNEKCVPQKKKKQSEQKSKKPSKTTQKKTDGGGKTK